MSGSVEEELVLVGASPASQTLLEDIQSAARTHAKVLILGETGVGKELVARLVHGRSARRTHPFVALNCSGIPETLLESELFGHLRGSFTGAYRDKPGWPARPSNGTLFLDELGEMSQRMQAVLLRFAETGEIQPIGSDRSTGRIDVRLVAATHRDLPRLVAAREFREDLYYRLNVIQICVPPLRDRRADIPALLRSFPHRARARHYRAPVPTLARRTAQCLQEYAWPGNIRELKNLVERLVVNDAGRPIRVEDLPDDVRSSWHSGGSRPADASGHDAPEPPPAPSAETVHALLWSRLQSGETFWSCIVEPFRNHDLTRADIRTVVQRGLDETQGSYRGLLDLFNLPAADYKRVLAFLRQHKCQVPLPRLRGIGSMRMAACDARRRRQAS